MPMVEFKESDLLRNKIVTPGWYLCDVGMFTEWTASADKNSNNSKTDFTVVRNADNGDTSFAGVPVEVNFNDQPKARSFIEGFLNAFLAAEGKVVQAGRYDLSAANGRQIEAYIETKEYQGRYMNTINHKYRPLKEVRERNMQPTA